MKKIKFYSLLNTCFISSLLIGMKGTYLDLLPGDIQKSVKDMIRSNLLVLAHWASKTTDTVKPTHLGVKGYPFAFSSKDILLAAISRTVEHDLFVKYAGIQLLTTNSDAKTSIIGAPSECLKYTHLTMSPDGDRCWVFGGKETEAWNIKKDGLSKEILPSYKDYRGIYFSASNEMVTKKPKIGGVTIYSIARLPDIKEDLQFEADEKRNTLFPGIHGRDIVIVPYNKGYLKNFSLETQTITPLTTHKGFKGRAFMDPHSGNIYALEPSNNALSKEPLRIMRAAKSKTDFSFGRFIYTFEKAHTLSPIPSGSGLIGITRTQKKEGEEKREDVIAFYSPEMEKLAECYGSECAISKDNTQLAVANKAGDILLYDLNKLSLRETIRLSYEAQEKRKLIKEREEAAMKGRS